MTQKEQDKLWWELYGMLCRYPTVRNALANLDIKDKHKIDDEAEAIIAEAVKG